ncbi:MAG TPA: glycosyltransferase family 39 protein [Solirubrobacteraceae bacterium]|nr:glycosyltransferase family 39 protein [Solirubrobacteraceae bacterium]
MKGPLRRWEWAAITAITVAAAILRLLHLGEVSPDPFYDAAVRSMSLSFHNFFFGAFEPSGSVSIDKPPVDLWLQVASVKLFGFSSTTLKLPEALAGTLAVPMLFAAVRRMWSPPAAVAAALALAVLPIEVITSRSDTMDGVMMALTVLALLLVVYSLERGSTPLLLAGAAALGVAFDVKLLESLVALPGIAVLALLGLPGTYRRRLLQLVLAGLVYVAVALSWLTATLLVPSSERPFAIGSTNGSAWNAAFVFNGTERLAGKSPEPGFTTYTGHYPEKTEAERAHIPVVPPSATRLFARVGPLSADRLGLEVLIALLLGVPALAWGVRHPGEDPDRERDPEEQGSDALQEPPPEPEGDVPVALGKSPATDRGSEDGAGRAAVQETAAGRSAAALEAAARMRRGVAAGLGLWMLAGIVLFSHMARLHVRYVEGLTPAVAAMFGIGVSWAASPRGGRGRVAWLAAVLLITVVYDQHLLFGRPTAWWIALLAALGAICFAVVSRTSAPGSLARSMLGSAGVLAMTLLATLAIPLRTDVTAIKTHVSDAGFVGALAIPLQNHLSAYVRAHQDGAYYELAAESATQIGSLIVKDARPILVLTTYGSHVLTTVPELERLIAEGKVRYAYLPGTCTTLGASTNPGCTAPVLWIRKHGHDVSRKAGLTQPKSLWLLPGVAP